MVYLILAAGFEEVEAVTILDILRRGNIQVKGISIMGEKLVYGAHDMALMADDVFDNVDITRSNMVILPGGMGGTENIKNHKGLRNAIIDAHEKEVPIAAICAAPTALASFGILKGKEATCYPDLREDLIGARYSNKKIAEDRGLITSTGPAAAMDFALYIVEKIKGREVADKVASDLLFRCENEL